MTKTINSTKASQGRAGTRLLWILAGGLALMVAAWVAIELAFDSELVPASSAAPSAVTEKLNS